MSFGWSAGDIATALRVAWTVYQCFTDGPRNASREFSEFKQSLLLIIDSLKKLNEIFSFLPQGQGSELARTFAETEAACLKFVEKHQVLTKRASQDLDAHGHQPLNFIERCKWAFQTVSWPMERDTAQRLRNNLDSYVKAASLRASYVGLQADHAIYSNTNTLLREAETARAERLEILKAVKYAILDGECIPRELTDPSRHVSEGVELMLRRCALGTTTETGIDHQFLKQFSQRALPQLFSPGVHGSQSILPNPPNQGSPLLLEPGPFPDGPSADQILDNLRWFSQTMEFLVIRLNTSTGFVPVEQRIAQDVGRPEDLQPVMSLVRNIRGTVDAALNHVGFHEVSLPRDRYAEASGEGSSGNTRSERPEQTISRALQDWDNLNERTSYHLRHFNPEEPRTSNPELEVPAISPTSPRIGSRRQSTHLRTSLNMQAT